MDSLYEYLLSFNLTQSQIDKISSIFSNSIILEKGEYFHKENKVANQIGFITSGMCRYFYNTNKDEVTRWVALPNEFILSVASFIQGTKSIENIQALKKTEILIAEKDDWRRLYDENDFVKMLWVKNIENNFIGFENRVFNLIALTADERYNWMLKHQPQFNINVPDKYIASMLGIKPRHLSRLRASKK